MQNRYWIHWSLSGFLLLWALAGFAYDPAQKEIVFGTTVGDFSDMVKESLKPQLEKKGYKVKLIEFTDFIRPNIALSEGALDANLFQHKPYLDEFVRAKGLKLSSIVQVPTAPLGIYAGRLKQLSQVKEGSSVAIPNDPTNMARALSLLASLGWIEVSKSVNPLIASVNHIETNLKKLKIIQLEAAQLPRTLSDVDYAIINGNFAVDAGIDLTSALTQEPGNTYVNWVVVRTVDLHSEFAKDIVKGFNSKDFRNYAKKKFRGYKFPVSY